MSFAAFQASIESQSLRRVADHWNEMRAGHAMPEWSRLELPKIEKLIPILWAYRFDRTSGKFVGLMAGPNIEHIFGKPFSGTPMEELYPPKDYPRLFARAGRVMNEPAYYRGTGMVFNHLDHSGTGERIMMPLGSDGAHGDGVLGATVYEFFLGERVEQVPDADAWFGVDD